MTVAFPFSQIRLQEPSEELRLLADVVADLADRVAKLAEDAPTKAIQERAHQLAGTLAAVDTANRAASSERSRRRPRVLTH